MESIKTQEIKNIVGKVGGYLTDKEGELLYSLAKNCKGKGVIELALIRENLQFG